MKNSIKIEIDKIFLNLICLLPLADSINGYINGGGNDGGLSFGIIYRAIIIILSLYFMHKTKITKKNFVYIIMILFSLVMASINGIDTLKSFLNISLRLILPILLIITFTECKRKKIFSYKDIQRIFDIWSILFPITILLPYFLGYGFSTYGVGAAGYKGFYYAQNDIGFILALLYLYSFYSINDKLSITCIFRLLLILASNLILGLKSNYLYVGVITIGYLLKINNSRFKTKLIVIIGILIGGLFLIHHYSDQLLMITERWTYFYNRGNGGLSFWTSTRIDRLKPAFEFMVSNNLIFNLLFGTGMNYTLHTMDLGLSLIEMDLFDLFFQIGIVGCISLLFFYKRYIKLSKINSFYYTGVLLSVVSGTLAGHVFESPLSGMVFSLVCIGTIFENRAQGDINGK